MLSRSQITCARHRMPISWVGESVPRRVHDPRRSSDGREHHDLRGRIRPGWESGWRGSCTGRVLAYQPHVPNQPTDVHLFWGCGLFPDRVGDFVPKAMADCNGAEILQELCVHLRFDPETVASAKCIPCRMLISPVCSCPANAAIDHCRCRPLRRISRSSANSSRFPMRWSLPSSIRCVPHRWPSMCCWVSTARSPPVTPYAASFHAQFEALIKSFE